MLDINLDPYNRSKKLLILLCLFSNKYNSVFANKWPTLSVLMLPNLIFLKREKKIKKIIIGEKKKIN